MILAAKVTLDDGDVAFWGPVMLVTWAIVALFVAVITAAITASHVARKVRREEREEGVRCPLGRL